MALPSRRRKFVAIDYDRRELRLAVFECARRTPTILGLHTAAIGPEVDPAEAMSLGAFLKTAVDRIGLHGARAVMCVGRAQAVLKSLSLPPAPDRNELASMVQFQISKELPFGADEAVVDFTRGAHWDTASAPDEAGEGTTVLVAAVRVPVVDAARQICMEAGLKLERLGLRPYANLGAVYRSVRCQRGERLLLVDLTADEAEIDVMRDEVLEFSRAATIAPAAAAAGDRRDADDRAASVRRVVAEVTRSLQSFHAVERGGQIHACLVAGSTGLEKDVTAALSKTLSARCQVFDPGGGFSVASGPSIGGFGAALGLAAGQAAETLPFDFLNPKRPVPARDTRQLRVAAVVAAVIALIAGGALATRSYLGGKAGIVGSLQENNADLQKQKKGLTTLEKRLRRTHAALGAQPDWLEQVRRLAETLPPAEELYLTSLRCSLGKIALVGRVKDRSTVHRFEEKLMAVPGYEVRDRGSNPVKDRYGYSLEFRMEILVPAGAAGGPSTRPAAPPPPPGRSGKTASPGTPRP